MILSSYKTSEFESVPCTSSSQSSQTKLQYCKFQDHVRCGGGGGEMVRGGLHKNFWCDNKINKR